MKAVIAVALVATAVSAFQPALDPATVQQALAIGQSRLDKDRASFHAPYRLAVNRAPIDYIDIVTPFRRIALAAEQRMRLGERPFSQRQALELASTTPGVVDVMVELTFHPMHALVRVPEYEVTLVPAAAAKPLVPRSLDRVPRFGPRVDGAPRPLPGTPSIGAPRTAEPMLGGTVIAAFDGFALDANGVYGVVVTEKGKELARVRVELSRLR